MDKQEAVNQIKDLAGKLRHSSDSEVRLIASKLYTILGSLAQFHGLIPVEIDVEAGEIDESEWLRSAASNPAFDLLKDPEEDIYTLADGKPFNE